MNRPTVLKPSAQITQLSLISLKLHLITSIAVDGSRRGGSGSNHSHNLILTTIGYFHTYVDDSQLCLSSNVSCS